MFHIVRTDSGNKDFLKLVGDLDEYLREMDGKDHAFYHQYNQLDHIKYVVLVYQHHLAIGCGSLKTYDDRSMEVKRMYVNPVERGKKIGTLILGELEAWAKELGFVCCILETGRRQPEAISLYRKNGYQVIDNYGQYKDMSNSVCFSKLLT